MVSIVFPFLRDESLHSNVKESSARITFVPPRPASNPPLATTQFVPPEPPRHPQLVLNDVGVRSWSPISPTSPYGETVSLFLIDGQALIVNIDGHAHPEMSHFDMTTRALRGSSHLELTSLLTDLYESTSEDGWSVTDQSYLRAVRELSENLANGQRYEGGLITAVIPIPLGYLREITGIKNLSNRNIRANQTVLLSALKNNDTRLHDLIVATAELTRRIDGPVVVADGNEGPEFVNAIALARLLEPSLVSVSALTTGGDLAAFSSYSDLTAATINSVVGATPVFSNGILIGYSLFGSFVSLGDISQGKQILRYNGQPLQSFLGSEIQFGKITQLFATREAGEIDPNTYLSMLDTLDSFNLLYDLDTPYIRQFFQRYSNEKIFFELRSRGRYINGGSFRSHISTGNVDFIEIFNTVQDRLAYAPQQVLPPSLESTSLASALWLGAALRMSRYKSW